MRKPNTPCFSKKVTGKQQDPLHYETYRGEYLSTPKSDTEVQGVGSIKA